MIRVRCLTALILSILATSSHVGAQSTLIPFSVVPPAERQPSAACGDAGARVPVRFTWTEPQGEGPSVGWVVWVIGTELVVVDAQLIPMEQNYLDMRSVAVCSSILVLRLSDATYALHGPFSWPRQPSTIEVQLVPRRTVAGAGRSHHAPTWLGTTADVDPGWPLCRTLAGARWECLGVPAGAAGVVLLEPSSPVVFASIASAHETTSAAPIMRAGFGRLLVTRCGGGVCDGGLDAEAIRLQPPRHWPGSKRWERVPSAALSLLQIESSVFWVFGDEDQSDEYVELRSAGRATAMVPISDIRDGPPDSSLVVSLDEERTLRGSVRAAEGPVSGAAITAFAAVPGRERETPPALYAAARATTDAAGAYEYRGLHAREYELRVVHQQFGQAIAPVRATDLVVDVEMHAARQVVGTLMRGDAPAASVTVQVVPELTAALEADDPFLLVGGRGRSSREGRFALPLPAAGLCELRAGGDAGEPITRVPLGRAEDLPAHVELGIVQLGMVRQLSIVIDAPAACRLHAVGPIATGGFSMIEAKFAGPTLRTLVLPEPGHWALTLSCGARELSLEPSIVAVDPTRWEQTVQVQVRGGKP